jgi:hypothetical protein
LHLYWSEPGDDQIAQPGWWDECFHQKHEAWEGDLFPRQWNFCTRTGAVKPAASGKVVAVGNIREAVRSYS